MASSASFNYTGGWATFKVPDDVKLIRVSMQGAGSNGRRGGEVEGNLSVTPGQVLYIGCGRVALAPTGQNGGPAVWGCGGAGGAGTSGKSGGYSGGGYAIIRSGSTSGRILAVAGGAGGSSGDGGAGGLGGAAVGGTASAGTDGTKPTAQATGGTRLQGGTGGSSGVSSTLNGEAADDVSGTRGGTGGSSSASFRGHGGGGGGGGLRSGGGGQASYSTGGYPGGGGGGGSNYTDELTSASSRQGTGNTASATVLLTWSDPRVGYRRPTTPTLVSPERGAYTKATTLTLKARVNDPDVEGRSGKTMLQIRVRLSKTPDFANYVNYYSKFVKRGDVASVTFGKLTSNTHYYARIWAIDDDGNYSLQYTSADFYSNQSPLAPVLTAPADGFQASGLAPITFTWSPQAGNENQGQAAAQFRWRRYNSDVWHTHDIPGATRSYVTDPLSFPANVYCGWTVRVQDPSGLWGPWADERHFYVTGVDTPPLILGPRKAEAVDLNDDIEFTWRYRDVDAQDSQYKADIRWRVLGTPDNAWVVDYGDTNDPGSTGSTVISAERFRGKFTYEWQVRTYSAKGDHVTPSQWSESATFITISALGGNSLVVPDYSRSYDGVLGQGENIPYLAVKGGMKLLGALTPNQTVKWGRTRDDISTCTVIVNLKNRANSDTAQLMSQARSWLNEIVVYRNGKRVWEGPVTKIAYYPDRVELQARDVLGWVYRRIMRQGFADAYPNMISIVRRAARIIANALAPDDPNILDYLTLYEFDDDARSSRVRQDYASTAFEEIDDQAQKNGLDYTVVGRRIVLFDTHRSIGRLPELRSDHFSDPPVITEYGMNAATDFAVTNNAGIYGKFKGERYSYGLLEMLASSYADEGAPSDEVLTAAQKAELVENMETQAKRNQDGRSPAPLVVRVPDNSTLSPLAPVSMDFLVPGVWMPLRAQHVCREVSQWQKLDSVTVSQDEKGEKVSIVLSPAPGQGKDPDAESQDSGDGGDDGE